MATMATSGMPSALGVPTADDTMEISSDAGRGDQDIDLDFMGDDDANNGVDWMLQDAATDRGNQQASGQHASADDLMYDDGDEISYAEEDTMEDDTPAHTETHNNPQDVDIDLDSRPATAETLYDATEDVDLEVDNTYQEQEEETLIDYETLEDQGDQLVEPTQELNAVSTTSAIEEPLANEKPELAPHVEAISKQPTKPPQVGNEPSLVSDGIAPKDFAKSTDASSQAMGQDDLIPPVEEEVQHLESSKPFLSSQAHSNQHEAVATSKDDLATDGADKLTRAHSGPDSELASAPEAATTTQINNLTPLHPVTIYYASSVEYSLFPTSEHDDPNTFLLQNSSVASSTLIDFFRACRSVLDQDLNDDLELELYIDSLNLTIPEDSTHCRETSLAQIIEVYVELMRNAGFEDPPPLYVEMNVKDRLSAQLSSLFKAASEKKGLYDLPFYQDETLKQSPRSSGEEGEGGEDGEEEEEEVEEGEEEGEGEGEEEEELEDGVVEGGDDYAEEAGLEDANKEEKSGDYEREDQERVEDDDAEAQTANLKTEASAHDPQNFERRSKDRRSASDAENGSKNEGEDWNEDRQEHQNEPSQLVAAPDEGDESSSGSSTLQEAQLTAPKDYDDETSEAVQIDDVPANNQATSDEGQYGAQYYDSANSGPNAQESFGTSHEQHTDSFDNHTLDTDTFDQEYDDYNEYGAEGEYIEGAPSDEKSHGADEKWVQDDCQPEGADIATARSGTFEVPDESEEGDEDEITYDDEFAAENEETQEATTQEASETSPHGKRSREEDEDGLLDGSDQGSPKRARVSPHHI
ncbi:hypothetical protein, variant 1 [Verruconis gallopava]|uniref:Uncharacterized protein n=1 Tax=Verruconis gallopava TaxID=253628 RepID=A0A0D1YW23_9PEZI|nr:hypothetical protein, variant 1 [Verruconis gallopava]KIW04892.1 hypothetical protein, variant 1 [Verruconis gallopava]